MIHINDLLYPRGFEKWVSDRECAHIERMVEQDLECAVFKWHRSFSHHKVPFRK